MAPRFSPDFGMNGEEDIVNRGSYWELDHPPDHKWCESYTDHAVWRGQIVGIRLAKEEPLGGEHAQEG